MSNAFEVNEALARADAFRKSPAASYSVEVIGEERIYQLRLTVQNQEVTSHHFVTCAFTPGTRWGGKKSWRGRYGIVASPSVGFKSGSGGVDVDTELTGDALDCLLVNSLIVNALLF